MPLSIMIWKIQQFCSFMKFYKSFDLNVTAAKLQKIQDF